MQEINSLSLENAKLINKLKEVERTQKLHRGGGSSSPVTDMDMY